MGLLASLFLFSSAAFAVDTVSGNFASPSGVVFDSGGNDRGRAIAVDPSSNVYVAGKKPQAGGGMDWVVLKLDPSGVLLSSTGFNSGANTFEEPSDGILGGGNFIVAGSDANSRRLHVYSTAALVQVGAYADGQSGRFTAVISSGPGSLITASVVGGQMIINELLVPGLTMVSTRVIPGQYSPDGSARSLAWDATNGHIFAVAVDSTVGRLHIEELGAGLALVGATNFYKPEPFVGGAAIAGSGSGLYVVGLASGGANAVTYLFRLAGLSFLNVTTITATGNMSSQDERVVAIDPSNQDVFVGGSGPFPGLRRYTSDLLSNTQKTLFPTSSLVVQNTANLYAVEVNQSGPQDIQVHKKDFDALAGDGGGDTGVALASDGTDLFRAKHGSPQPEGTLLIEKFNTSGSLLSSATTTGVANEQIKALVAGGSLYVVGAASGPTTVANDAAIWKFNPATLAFVSSHTLNHSGFNLGEFVKDATTTVGGDLILTGAVQTGSTNYAAAVWKYSAAGSALQLRGIGPTNGVEFGNGIASTGSATMWIIGFSSQPANSDNRKMALALWRFQEPTALDLMSSQPSFGFSTDLNARLTATAGNLYAASERKNTVVGLDLAFLKYDLTGATAAVKHWHSESPSHDEHPRDIILNDAGDLVVAGGSDHPAPELPLYWTYSQAAVLSSGFPKTISGTGHDGADAAAKVGAAIYATTHVATAPFQLTGGTALPGAEGLEGEVVPLSFTFMGGPNTALKINSNLNRNEAGTYVLVDTTTGNFYHIWHSTTGQFLSGADVTSLGKFDAAGVMLASTTLLGDRSGDAAVYLNGNVYVQERSDDYTTLQYTKFNASLGRVFSLQVSSLAVGNITNAAAFGGNIYAVCDGASGTNGGAKVFKWDANLNELARSTYSNVGGSVHHNADGVALNAVGDLFVSVSTSEAGPARHLVKYDVNLVQLSSADVTAHFPDSAPQLAYGGGGVLYAMGNTNPAVAKMFVRKFNTALAYQGVSTTITVTGTTPSGRLNTDPDLNAIVTLTSSTADGGDFVTFKFNNSLVQLSSGQFDGGFGGADSGLSGVAVDTATVYLSGVGGNGAHKDAVVMKRSLPAGAGGGGLSFSFAGQFNDAGGATVSGSGGRTDFARHVQVTTTTPGGPHVYAVVASTTGSTGPHPYDALLVKYDLTGNVVSSATLAEGSPAHGFAMNDENFIFLTQESLDGQTSSIHKYDSQLVFQSSIAFPNQGVGFLVRLTHAGSLFATADPGSDGYPKVLKLDSNLNFLASHTFTGGPAHSLNGDQVSVAPNGTVYTIFGSTASGGQSWLVKYPSSLASVTTQVDAVGLLPNAAGLAATDSAVFAAAISTVNPNRVFLRRFDSGLGYSGVSATFTTTLGDQHVRLKAGQGELYVVSDATEVATRRLDPDFNLISSAPVVATAISIKDLGDVFVGGQNGASDAFVKRVNLVSGGGLVHAKAAAEFVVSETDNNEFILDAAFGSGKFLYTWQNKLSTGSPNFVRAQFVTPAGALSGPVIALDSGGGWCGESAPNVASDGTNFLLVAGCGSVNAGKTQAVVITATGAFAGPKVDLNAGHATGDIEHGNAAFDGTNYLVVWSSGAGAQRDVFGRFVSSGGALSGSPFAIATAAGHEREPNVVYGGAKYLAVWHDNTRLADGNDADIMGQFVLTTGVLDGAPFRIDAGNLGSFNPVSVGYNGTDFFVVYHEGPQGQYGVSGAVVSSTGGVASRFTIEPESGPNSHLAVSAPVWETDRWRVVWSDVVGHVGNTLVTLSSTVLKQQTFSGSGSAQGSPQIVASGVSGKIPYAGAARSGAGTTLLGLTRVNVGAGFDNTGNSDVYGLLLSSGWAPAPAVSSVTLAFSGSFLTGARAANNAGGADISRHAVFLSVGPSTFVYVTVHSTTGASPGATPDQAFLVKYDQTGVVLASAALLGNHSGDVLVAEGGFLYVSEKDSPGTMRRLAKYDANLNRLLTAPVDADAVGNITDGFGRGGFLYTINDGGNTSPGAKIIKYDLGLGEVKRATYSFGAEHANGNAVIVTPNGEVFVQVFSSVTTKFVKYDANLNPLAEANVSGLFPPNAETTGLAFANGVLLAASFDAAGTSLLVRKFDPALNYSGASSTFAVQTAPDFGLKAGPDGLFYVALTSYSADGGNYALKVLDSDLVVKASASFDAGFAGFDQAVGLGVLDSSNVFVTGAGLNAGNYDAVTFVKNLSAAGGGAAPAAGQTGGFWGLAAKDGRLWAVQRGLGVVRRYDFPAPPVSRTSPFSQELAAARPTALGVDGGRNLWVSVSTAPGAEENRRLVRYASSDSFGGVAPSTSNVLSSLLSDVHAVAFRPDTGDLWVAQGGGNPSIVTFLRDGASTLSTPTYSNAGASTFTTTAQLGVAEALAFDTGGNLWVTTRGLGEIRMYPKLAGSISQSTGQFINAVATPGAITFDAAGNMYVGETTETTPFSGKLWKFANLGSAASPSISNSPVLLQTGVDPTALAFVGGQLWGTSDLNDQIVSHPTEPPPPPAQFGTVSGSLAYAGAKTGTLRIAFSTDPAHVDSMAAATLEISTPGLGGFSVATLKAPNTYYIQAFRDGNGNLFPDGFEPFARRSAVFWGPLTPVFVAKDQTVTGVNLELFDTVAVTGTIVNNSAQPGSVRFDAWSGAPQASPTAARYKDDQAPFSGNPFYQVYVATVTDLHVRAYVDSNSNRRYDAGEDSGSVGPLNLSALVPGSTQLANITIAAGAAGQLFFNAASVIGANVPTNGEAAFLKLDAWSAGGNVQFTGLRVTLKGDAPSPNVFARVYKDANGNGTFQPGIDFTVGDRSFSGSVPPTAAVTFFSTQTVSGSTSTYFVGLQFSGLPAGKSVGVALDASSAFTFSAGSLAAGQGPFPVESALAITQFSLAARPSDQGYPVPQGGAAPSGGFDTGLYVNVGQRLEVNASGVWNTGALGTSGPGGLAGQTSTAAPAGAVNLGALIGRIGGAAWFKVGASTNFVSGQSGSLALAMNDSDYNDNSASLAVDFHIVPSTITRTWLGLSGFGQGADIAQNWQGGVVPQQGESVEFNGGVSSANCDWNLYYANVDRFEMKNGYAGRVLLRGSNNPGDPNQVIVDSHVIVGAGKLDLGRNQTLSVNGGVTVRGTLDMGENGSSLGAGHGVSVAAGGVFRFAGTGFPRVFSTAFEALGFEVLDGTVEVRGNGMIAGLRVERPSGLRLSASANILAFDGVQFDQFDAAGSASALVLQRSSAAVYSFQGLGFNNNFTKNVDASGVPAGASITLRDATGNKRGTPFENDPNGVVSWVPDGGGAPASVAGSVLDGGVIIAGSTVIVRASTQPFFDANLLASAGGAGGGGALVFITTRNSFGAYTLSGLQAPATYFLYAHRESIPMFPNDFPDGGEPRGAFGHPGLLRSDPVFVGSGQSLTAKDIILKDWFESSGTVTNASNQFGTILVAAALDSSTNTFESISRPVFGTAFPPLASPATSVILVGWVDVNNNRQKDSFEASGTFGPVVPPASTVTLTLGGGAAPPGGTAFVTTSAAHPGILGDSGPQAMLRLEVTGSGAQAALKGLKLDFAGGPQSFRLAVWADRDGNGRLDTAAGVSGVAGDATIGSTLAAGGSGSVLVNFFSPQFVNFGSTTTLFVAFEPQDLVAGHPKVPSLAVSIGASNYFLLDAGQMAAQAVYPIQTAAPIGWSVFAQTQGDAFGGGGYFTGVQVAAGQTVALTATGTWRFSGQPTDHKGLAGTEGQPTLARGSRVGAVLASVGNGWVAVGTGVSITASFPGGVHLSANDVPGDYYNNEGFVTASIEVSGSTTSRVEGTITYQGGLTGNMFVNLTQDCKFAPPGCNPILSTQTLTLSAGTTLYAYGLHVPFGGFFSVRAVAQSNPAHRSGFVPSFSPPLGSTATVNFPVFAGLGAITSTISYGGVMTFGEFRVGVTTSTDFEHEVFFFGGFSSPAAGAFAITDLPIPNTYYMVGFRDGNFNQEPDGPEAFGALASVPSSQLVLSQLSVPGVLTPIFVSSTAHVSPLVMADRGGLSGRLFFQQAVASGEVVIAAAHGVPGSPEFVFENRDFRFVQNIPAGGSVDYFLGLLKPATDYTLFAFLDQNFNGDHDSGEPFAQSGSPFLTVPAGGFANKDLTIGAPAAPPAVTNFGIVNFGSTFVEFRWDGTPGATGYLLLNASSATVVALGASATVYNETMTPASTSAVTGIRAVNAQGPGPIVGLPAGMSNAAAAVTVASPSFSGTAVSSLTVAWTSGGNGSLAKYQLERATQAAGPFQPVQYGTALSKNEQGLAPSTQYFYRVKAQSPNGGFAAPSATASATTLAAADPSVAGVISYAGQQAGDVRVFLSSVSPTGPPYVSATLPPSSQQPYYLPVNDGAYFLRAYVDVDGDGVLDAGEDRGSGPSVTVAGAPLTGQNFSIAVDTVTPGSPAGLRAATPFGRVELTWNAPASNSNGTPLTDLAGFRVQRTTAGPLNFVTLTAGTSLGVPNVTASPFFTDGAPVNSGTDNIYRVIAVDLGRNESIASGALAVKPALGGTISGTVSSFTATTAGAFRVRLSTSPRREDPFLSESTLQSFSFTGLADGTYHLRVFRDVNADNRQDAATEPSGTHGGIVAPFPLSILNGNTVTGRVVTACDRVALTLGQAASGTLLATDCPAADKGPGFFTDLHTFRVGGGVAGSIGVGSSVDLSLKTPGFSSELIVLGPDGQVVARDNTAGGAHVNFPASQAGLYVVEPTSFFAGQTGSYDLFLNVFGGFSGSIVGRTTYAGSKTGPVRLQVFDRPDASAFPFLVMDQASTGTFSIGGLRDGAFYLRAFRDVNGNFAKDPGEPSGAFGFSESSPTAINVTGGVASAGSAVIALADPSTGRIEGQVLRQGSLPGTIRVEVGERACGDCSDLNVVAFTTIAAAGPYVLDFIPPATTYIVQSFVDGNANNRADALEAKGSSSPITVSVNSTSTVNVLVRDPGTGTAGSAVVFGTVSYSGASTGTVFIGFASDQNFNFIPYFLTQSATGFFSKSGLQGGTTYFVGAFIDVNGNGTIDEDGATVEPVGNFDGEVFVPNSSSVGVAFTIPDPSNGRVSGVVTYNGSVSGPLVVQAAREGVFSEGGHGGFRSVSVPRSVGVSSYAYTAGFLDAGSFRLFAFVDSNGNQHSDFGEPFFRRDSLVAVSSGTGGAPVTGVNLLVLDAGAGGGGGAVGTISGTLGYAGTQPGPVLVQLSLQGAAGLTPLRTVTAGGGPNTFSFSFDNLAAGGYVVSAFKDANLSGALEPQFEANGAVSGGATITISNDNPFSGGHTGTLADAGAGGPSGGASLSGTAQYRGSFTTGTFHLALFQDANFDGRTDDLLRRSTFAFSTAPFSFAFSGLPSGRFFLRAFLDRNDNFAPDAFEPFGLTDASGLSVFGPVSGVLVTVCDRFALDLTPGAQNLHTLNGGSCPSPEAVTSGAARKLLTFRGARGQTFDATLTSQADNYLHLYDPNGQLVAEADEGGSKAGDARLFANLPASGDYTLAAGFFAAGVAGDVKVTLSNSGGTPGSIAGNIRYTGSQGGRILTALFNNANFDAPGSFVDFRELLGPGPFSYGGLASETTYFLGAFVDVNFNHNPDPGEDFGVFSTAPPVASPVFLRSGQDLVGLVLDIAASTAAFAGKEGQVTGVISYPGTLSGVLRVEFWADAAFRGAPLAVRTIPTGVGPYDLSIPGGQPYVVRGFLDLNGDFVPGPDEPQGLYAPSGQGAEPVFVPSSGTVSGVSFSLRDPGIRFGQTEPSGEGRVSLAPAALAAGGLVNAVTFTYVAEGRGIRQGGVVVFGVPFGFPFPQNGDANGFGFVPAPVLTNPGGVAPSVQLSFPAGQPAAALKVVSSTPLYAGATVQFVYRNVPVPCFAFDLSFFTGSASTGTVPPGPLFSGTPGILLGAGAAAAARSAEENIGLLQNTTSQRLLLETVDACGNRVAVGANANVVVRAKRYVYATGTFDDTTLLRLSSATTGVFDSTAVVSFAAGRSSAAYHAVGTGGGDFFVELAANFAGAGATGYANVTVFANNSLSDVSVATVPFLLGRTSATITPTGGAAAANQAFINFTLGDPTRFWTVAVASTPFKLEQTPEPIAFFSGQGQPARGQVAWDGRDFRGARVPRGVYYVRVDVGGLRDDSLRVAVEATELKMKVFDAGVTPNVPLSGVGIESFGTLGGGAEFLTDVNGELTLAGLGAGDYRLRFAKDGYLAGRAQVTLSSFSTVSSMTAADANVALSSNAAGLLTVQMRRAPSLVIVPSIAAASTQPFVLWGSLQVENSTNAFSLNGPMRLQAGATTFDDGGQWDPSLQQFVTKTILRFSLASGTYTVRASLPGFDPLSQGIVIAPEGQTTVVLPAFAKRSFFTGQVFLPAGNNTQGTFVSVSAVPLTTTTAVEGGFGGVFVPALVNTATYRVEGLRPGSYRLTANTQGLKAVTIASATVVASSFTTVDFSSFPVANTSVITATVGVTGFAGHAFPELEPGGPGLRLNISAWAPNSPNGFYDSIAVATSGAGGVNIASQTVVVNMTGLDEGVEYQVFAGLDNRNGDFDAPGGFPKRVTVSTVTGRAALAFDFAAASGVIRGAIYIPGTDFSNVELFGETIAAAKPDQVGRTFRERVQDLPGIVCGNGASTSTLGNCTVNVASFTVTGLNTETNDITLTYKTTGRTLRTRLSVVNGSTTTFLADLRNTTAKISGQIANQVTDPLFNTNALIVANAAQVPVRDAAGAKVAIDTSTVDLGGAPTVDSLARVLAIRQQFGVSASTSFNPATDRVGYLTAAGTYTIRNLTPGVYLLRTADIRSCATCQVVIPRRVQTVSVTDADANAAATVSASSFTLSDGFSVTGVITLSGGVQDSANFRLTLRNRRQEVVRSTGVALGNAAAGVAAGSVAYRLDGVPAGDFYTLSVQDSAGEPKYIAKPLSFPDPSQSPGGLAGSITGQDVLMRQAAYVTGKLKDAASGELFNEFNAKVLPPNLRIIAVANPWVEGGFAQAASSAANRPIRADGSFLVGPLFPEVSYDLQVFQDKWDLAFLAQGSQNYAPAGVSGLTLQPVERKDVGTLALNQGTSIKGTLVRAASTTTALGNIRVTAKPSLGDVELNVETYSNPQGQFTLWVSTFVSPQYDLTVAPRGGNLAADGKSYKTVELPRLKVADAALTVQLTELAAAVTGQVFTADGGALLYPFDGQEGFPAAAVFLQPSGVNPKDNPLGDISVVTESDGKFAVPALSSGVYVIRAVSLGYGVVSGTVTVTATSFCISTTAVVGSCQDGLTLRRGGVVKGRISLPDGSAPSTDEIGGVAAADDGFAKFVVGTIDSDEANRTVSGYSITGFEPGVAYNIVLLPPSRDDADVIFPTEGQGVTFTAAESTTTKTINLTYSRIVPDCEATAVEKAVGNGQFQVKIACTEPLRNRSADDNDLDKVLSVSSCVVNGVVDNTPDAGCGAILGGADKKIESSRKQITVVYRTGNDNEEKFTLKLDAFMATVDPATGDNFHVSKLFTFDTLFRKDNANEEDRVVVANTEEEVSNAQGGEVNLDSSERDADGEQFSLNFGEGSFEDCDAGDTDSNCAGDADTKAKNKVKVTVKGSLSASDAANRTQATLGYVPSRIQAVLARAGSFGPLSASSSTKNSFGKSPLSTFYDIFLPLGIRSQLNKPVDLTMPYDLSLAPTTPISDIQIWSKSIGNIGKAGCTGQFCPENKNTRVDTVNKTVTVSVDHFSQFVVLNGPPQFTGSATFKEDRAIAFNIPNPFDCRTRTVACNAAEGSCAAANITGVGTLIHYAAPGSAATSLDHRFRIYNVAGELVDEFHKTAAAGTHHYDFWDCTNSSGRPVASGVYILEYHVNGQSVYHKMAVIKGSGL